MEKLFSLKEIADKHDQILPDTCAIMQCFGTTSDLEDRSKSINFWENEIKKNLNKFYFLPGVCNELENGKIYYSNNFTPKGYEKFSKSVDSFLEMVKDSSMIDFDDFEKRRLVQLKEKYQKHKSNSLSLVDYDLMISSFVLSDRTKNSSLLSNDSLLSFKFHKIKEDNVFEGVEFYSRPGFDSFDNSPLAKAFR